jgi:hypothetical protein
MKKFIELIRTKERDDKTLSNSKKASAKDAKLQPQNLSNSQPIQLPRDLFWDDYSDVGYC